MRQLRRVRVCSSSNVYLFRIEFFFPNYRFVVKLSFRVNHISMEMKNVIAREGREAKNLILYHLSSEDESK